MKRLCRFLTMLAVAVAAASLRSQEPVARIEITSYQQLSADVMSLGMHIQNPMLNMGLMALGNALGAPGLLGLDQERPIRMALFADGGDLQKAERVLVLPVLEDGAKYLEALKANYTSVEDDGKVRRFRATRQVQSFREMSVAFVGGFAVVSPSKPLLDRVVGWLQESPDRLAVGGIAGSVLVSVDATAVLPALRRRLDEQMRVAEAAPAEEGPAAAMAEMLRVYSEGVLAVLEQALSLKLAFQCNEQGLTLYGRFDAVPDTTLAQLCAEAKTPSPRLRALLPADATMTYCSGALGAFARLGMKPYLEFASRLLEAQKKMLQQAGGDELMKGFDLTKMMELSQRMTDCYGDDFVASFGPSADGKSVLLFEAITVKNPEKILGAMTESLDMASTLYGNMGIPFRFVERPKRTVDGAEVRVFAAEMVEDKEPAPAAEAPAAKPPAVPDGAAAGNEDVAKVEDDDEDDEEDEDLQAQLAEEMREQLQWLTKGVVETVVVDDLLLVAMGLPGSVDPFIAKARNPPADTWTARSKELFPEMRNHDKAVELWTLRPLAMMKNLAPLVDPEDEATDALAQLPDDGKGMGGLSMTSPTAAMGAFRVSASQLGALVRSVQTLQKLGQQGGAAGRPPAPPMGAPVDVVIPEP